MGVLHSWPVLEGIARCLLAFWGLKFRFKVWNRDKFLERKMYKNGFRSLFFKRWFCEVFSLENGDYHRVIDSPDLIFATKTLCQKRRVLYSWIWLSMTLEFFHKITALKIVTFYVNVKSNKRLSTLPQLAHPLNLIGLNNPNQTVFYSYLKVKKWRNLWSPYHLNLRTKCVLKLAKKFWHNVSLPAKSDSGAAHVQVETITQRFTQLPHDKSRKNHWGSFAVELDFLKVKLLNRGQLF